MHPVTIMFFKIQIIKINKIKVGCLKVSILSNLLKTYKIGMINVIIKNGFIRNANNENKQINLNRSLSLIFLLVCKK